MCGVKKRDRHAERSFSEFVSGRSRQSRRAGLNFSIRCVLDGNASGELYVEDVIDAVKAYMRALVLAVDEHYGHDDAEYPKCDPLCAAHGVLQKLADRYKSIEEDSAQPCI